LKKKNEEEEEEEGRTRSRKKKKQKTVELISRSLIIAPCNTSFSSSSN
jgi:phosphate/sulfate permease